MSAATIHFVCYLQLSLSCGRPFQTIVLRASLAACGSCSQECPSDTPSSPSLSVKMSHMSNTVIKYMYI